MMKKLVALLMALALLCTSIGAFAEVVPVEPKNSETPTEAPTVPPTAEVPTETPTETPTAEVPTEAPTATPWDVVSGVHYADKEDEIRRQEATCEEDGWIEYECQNPDCVIETFVITIPAKGHKIPEGAKVDTDSYIKTPATCEGTGIRVWKKCANGDHEWEEVIGPLGHSWEKKLGEDGKPIVVAPTCLEPGYTVYECVRPGCDAEKLDDVTTAQGHLWAPNPDALIEKGYINGDGELVKDVPDYDPDDADILYLYTWSEADSVTCVDGGKLV